MNVWQAIGRWPLPVRHLTLLVLVEVGAWAATGDLSPRVLLAGVGSAVVAWGTPLVQGYGPGGNVGVGDAP